MDIYHFVRYTGDFAWEDFYNKYQPGTIICFDLEDSIQDINDTQKTSGLKDKYRNLLKKILEQKDERFSKIKVGVRINGCQTNEQIKDLELLSGSKGIHSVFLPKAENAQQISKLVSLLDKGDVKYEELIPVIETRTGMKNLEYIARSGFKRVKSIAFGHCDYNLDCGNFPFFHHNSREYWSWVEKIISVIQPYNFKFVNSPFLELGNHEAFREMLSSMNYVCGTDYGQVVLTFGQAAVCSGFADQAEPMFKRIPNRLQLKPETVKAENFIKIFRQESHDKPFALAGKNRILMSPQEYLAAENCLKQRELPEFNFTFVGGCFPVQGSILFEKLFHQQVKNRMENEHAVNFNISIIRYERFTGCLEKLKAATRSQRMDAVVFCIRPEPVLRLTKISYRFADKNGRIKRKFNLPSSKYPFPEKHDLLSRLTTFIPSTQRKIPGSGLWSNLNYFAGILIGNNKVAMQRYLILVNEVADFCKKNSIPLFVMGPALRTNRFMEKVISQRLETFMKMQIPVDYVHYIRGSDQIKDGKKLFDPNGIHANEYYHKLIAGRIYSKLEGLVKEAVLLKRSIPDAETV